MTSNVIKYKHKHIRSEKGDGGDGSDGDDDINDDQGDGQGDSRQFCVHERRYENIVMTVTRRNMIYEYDDDDIDDDGVLIRLNINM